MTEKQLRNYIKTGDEIEFNYNGKRYSITYLSTETHKHMISFCEFYKEPIDFLTYEDFKNNAKIDGKSVVEILYGIDDADVF